VACSDTFGDTQVTDGQCSSSVKEYFDLQTLDMQALSQQGTSSVLSSHIDDITTDYVLRNFSSYPRDVLVQKLTSEVGNNETLMEKLRLSLFEQAKVQCVDIPNGACLKKRKSFRSGDSVLFKLAKDCSCLIYLLNGESVDEIKDLISCKQTFEFISVTVD